MLPFSSITSIVPLFILAFAYFVYFGASLVNRISPAKEIPGDEVVVKAEINSGSLNYPDYRHAFDDVPAKAESCSHDFPLRDLSCIFLQEIPHGKPVPLHPVSQFSPRPPPCL